MKTKSNKETIDSLKANIQYLVNMSQEFGLILLEELQEIADYIKTIEDENLSNKPTQLQTIDYYHGDPIAIHRNGDVYFNLTGLKIAIDKLYSSDEKYRGRRSWWKEWI